MNGFTLVSLLHAYAGVQCNQASNYSYINHTINIYIHNVHLFSYILIHIICCDTMKANTLVATCRKLFGAHNYYPCHCIMVKMEYKLSYYF